MITLKDFMEAIQYQITDGAEYMWECYGPNAWSLDYWNQETGVDGRSVSVVFDKQTQFVYQVEAWDQSTDVAYRWIHPDYIEDVKDEAESRGVSFEESFDGNKFTDLDVEEDILEKAAALVSGEEYDKRVMVTLSLSYDEEHMLMEMAHEADMALNQFVEHIMREEIERLSE